MREKELQKILNKTKPIFNTKYPKVGKRERDRWRILWIDCGTEEKQSERNSMKVIINTSFQDFIKKNNAAWGLRRIIENGKTVWKIQIRY